MLLYDEGGGSMLSSGVPIFREDICCIYMDLDSLIETCGLTKAQRFVVDEVMKGYRMADIAAEFSLHRQSVDAHFKTAVQKIVKRNNERWKEWAERRKTPEH